MLFIGRHEHITLSAQITSSPYSIFGIGNTEGNSTGAGNAMGGTGIAFLTTTDSQS